MINISCRGSRITNSFLNHRFSLSRQYRTGSYNSFLNSFGDIYSLFRGKSHVGSARNLFFICVEQSNKSSWYDGGKIGSEFRSRHTLLLVHIWLINRRLLAEGHTSKRLQECFFDQLWENTSSRIRSLGVSELSVNKHLKDVQQYSFRFLFELDHAVSLLIPATNNNQNTNNTKENVQKLEGEAAVLDSMGGTLWRLLYLRKDESLEKHCLQLANYIRREQVSLEKLPYVAVTEARIKWGPVPLWGKLTAQELDNRKIMLESIGDDVNDDTAVDSMMMSSPSSTSSTSNGESHSSSFTAAASVPVDVWQEAHAPDGRIYYWNIVTRESRWEKPSPANNNNKNSTSR